MEQQKSITKQTTTEKEYHCYGCGQRVMFINGQYDRRTGKAKRFNMNGTPHICGQKEQQQEREPRQQQQRQQQNSHKSQYSRETRYWRYFWGFGKGREYRERDQRYSGEQYDYRRERAEEAHQNYRRTYQSARPPTRQEDACDILQISRDVLKMKVEEAHKIIKTAFRVLALKYHPDRNHAPEASELFRKMYSAYELLMATIKRVNF